jgi:hypothetical protein
MDEIDNSGKYLVKHQMVFELMQYYLGGKIWLSLIEKFKIKNKKNQLLPQIQLLRKHTISKGILIIDVIRESH